MSFDIQKETFKKRVRQFLDKVKVLVNNIMFMKSPTVIW